MLVQFECRKLSGYTDSSKQTYITSIELNLNREPSWLIT